MCKCGCGREFPRDSEQWRRREGNELCVHPHALAVCAENANIEYRRHTITGVDFRSCKLRKELSVPAEPVLNAFANESVNGSASTGLGSKTRRYPLSQSIVPFSKRLAERLRALAVKVKELLDGPS